MIRAVIFDADGTLLDSMEIWNQVGARYLISLGKVPEENLSDILFPMTLEESSSYLKERYGLLESVGEIRRGILGIIDDFYRKEVKVKKGVKEFLRRMDDLGIPMVIATSGDRELLAAALKRERIEQYFRAVFTCSDLNTSKQEGRIYRAAAEFLGTDPGHTAVFEDVLFALEAARGAGFITVGVEDKASEHEKEKIKEISDFYLTDFSDWRIIEKESRNENSIINRGK